MAAAAAGQRPKRARGRATGVPEPPEEQLARDAAEAQRLETELFGSGGLFAFAPAPEAGLDRDGNGAGDATEDGDRAQPGARRPAWEDPADAGLAVGTVKFHHNAQLLMTAGLDKTLRFFQVDGKKNPKVQSVFLEDMPVHKAAFTGPGSLQVLAAGRRQWFYVYDIAAGKVERLGPLHGREEKSLESFVASPSVGQSGVVAFLGNDGYIVLVSQKSWQWIGNLKMNGTARTAAFAGSGYELVTGGGDGDMYLWDLRMQRCIHKRRDEGSVGITSLALSSQGGRRSLACGSAQGVVNMYDAENILQAGTSEPSKDEGSSLLEAPAPQAMVPEDAAQVARELRMLEPDVIHHWSTEHVVQEFLNRLDLSYLADTFQKHRVTGRVLMQLTEEHLREMGISCLGDRLTIMENLVAIKGIRWTTIPAPIVACCDDGPRPKRTRGRATGVPEPPEEQLARDAAEAQRLETELFGSGGLFAFAPAPEAGLDRDGNGAGDATEDGGDGAHFSARRPAWEDPADAGLAVGVAHTARLRKLRRTEAEASFSGAEYAQRLRAQHERLNAGAAAWAALPPHSRLGQPPSSSHAGDEGSGGDDGASDGDDGVEERALLAPRGRGRLPQGLLETTRLANANRQDPSKAVVQVGHGACTCPGQYPMHWAAFTCFGRSPNLALFFQTVKFHHNAQLLMTAGLDKTLRFFQVDGKKNPKVQSVFLEDMPVHKAAFTGPGSLQVLAAGRRQWFYVYDIAAGKVERLGPLHGREEKSLESFVASPSVGQSGIVAFLGNDGYIVLVSQKSWQWIGNLKMNGTARTAAFAGSGNELVTGGGDGDMYLWDLRMQRCIHKRRDEGSVGITSLALSSQGGRRSLACGSAQGVVNMYDAKIFLQAGSSEPTKVLMNLTTSVDTLQYNGDGDILAMASHMRKDALRLVHVPSGTVFSNWPTSRSPLQFVHSLDFSPGGAYLAIGNARGQALLIRRLRLKGMLRFGWAGHLPGDVHIIMGWLRRELCPCCIAFTSWRITQQGIRWTTIPAPIVACCDDVDTSFIDFRSSAAVRLYASQHDERNATEATISILHPEASEVERVIRTAWADARLVAD
eukprot:SM000052S17756  [mRNA]  locus=s52:554239:568465:+ [translate_table: standard]